VVGRQIDPGPYDIGVRKQDAQLRTVLQAALRAIIQDGSYDRVLAKWDVSDGALRTAAVTGTARRRPAACRGSDAAARHARVG
jgi:polar amino acid transport system substrate-binding protein